MSLSFIRWFFAATLLFTAAGIAGAQTAAPATPAAAQPGGRILVARVTGDAFAMNPADGLKFPIRNGSLLTEGQVITTGAGASVLFVLSNGATVSLGADSVLSLEQFTQQPFGESFKMSALPAEPTTSTTRLNLLRGELISDVKKLKKDAGSSFQIKTPVGAAGIRGTAFRIAFKPEGDRAAFALVMLEGVIEQTFGNRGRPVVVPQGKQVVVTGIEYNGRTGEVGAIPPVGEPTDVPASVQASLFQLVQQMLATVGSMTISSASVQGNTSSGSGGGSTAEAAAAPSAGTASPVSPSPGPQLPAARTSPTDGQPKG
ncbi:MAG: FecR family protein [Nibricoccus sp.]